MVNTPQLFSLHIPVTQGKGVGAFVNAVFTLGFPRPSDLGVHFDWNVWTLQFSPHHALVEVPLESLFQTVLGLAHILFLASSAGYTAVQSVAVAHHIVFRAVFSASNDCYNVSFHVQ